MKNDSFKEYMNGNMSFDEMMEVELRKRLVKDVKEIFADGIGCRKDRCDDLKCLKHDTSFVSRYVTYLFRKKTLPEIMKAIATLMIAASEYVDMVEEES